MRLGKIEADCELSPFWCNFQVAEALATVIKKEKEDENENDNKGRCTNSSV